MSPDQSPEHPTPGEMRTSVIKHLCDHVDQKGGKKLGNQIIQFHMINKLLYSAPPALRYHIFQLNSTVVLGGIF